MTDEEKVTRLKQALKEPEGKYTHAQIREKLNSFPTGLSETVGVRAPAEDPSDDGVLAAALRGLKRVGDSTALKNVASFANRAVDKATFGLHGNAMENVSDATGVRVGSSAEEMQGLDGLAGGFADATGYVAPVGLPAKLTKVVSMPIDALTRTLAGRLTTRAGRVSERMLSGGAKGATSGAAVSGVESAVRGDSMPETVDRLIHAAKVGGVIGGGLGTVGGVGGEIATARRAASPDLQVLHEAGLEPSLIPGRPVVRQGQSMLSQIPLIGRLFPGDSSPPLVGRATPATRGAAGRRAADEIIPDMRVREKASNQRFGELQAEAYRAHGNRPVNLQPIVESIDARLANRRLPDTTRAGLMAVRDRLVPRPPPQLADIERMLADPRTSPRAREGLLKARDQIAPPPAGTAQALDEVRDYADSKVRSGEIDPGDVQFIQVANLMREEVGLKAPAIAKVNSMNADVIQGFQDRRVMLGAKKGDTDVTRASAARRIRERGEETATAGVKTGEGGHPIDRLSNAGPPTTLPGTRDLPPDPSYDSLLKVPRLQLAQENMQIVPGQPFSGATAKLAGMMLQTPRLALDRGLYPLARRAGAAEIGTQPLAIDELSRAVRQRGKKKKQTEEEEEAR